MDCPHCRYPETRVVETNPDDRINQIYRRRECIKCAKRFTTQEHYRENYQRTPYKTDPPIRVLPK